MNHAKLPFSLRSQPNGKRSLRTVVRHFPYLHSLEQYDDQLLGRALDRYSGSLARHATVNPNAPLSFA